MSLRLEKGEGEGQEQSAVPLQVRRHAGSSLTPIPFVTEKSVVKVKREASGGTSREFRETSRNLGEGTADAAGEIRRKS